MGGAQAPVMFQHRTERHARRAAFLRGAKTTLASRRPCADDRNPVCQRVAGANEASQGACRPSMMPGRAAVQGRSVTQVRATYSRFEPGSECGRAVGAKRRRTGWPRLATFLAPSRSASLSSRGFFRACRRMASAACRRVQEPTAPGPPPPPRQEDSPGTHSGEGRDRKRHDASSCRRTQSEARRRPSKRTPDQPLGQSGAPRTR